MKIAPLAMAIAVASCAPLQDGNYPGNPGGPYGPPSPRPPAQYDPYDRPYSYRDDIYYNECRNSVDPAGVIAGALIGGLLANAIADGGPGGTIAGVVVGGAAGALLTRDLECDDRSYAYRSYYDGLNARRPNSRYGWDNPRTGNRGNFYVHDYYRGEKGRECANFSQTIWIRGRPEEATGRACRQADGTWAIVS